MFLKVFFLSLFLWMIVKSYLNQSHMKGNAFKQWPLCDHNSRDVQEERERMTGMIFSRGRIVEGWGAVLYSSPIELSVVLKYIR